MCQCPLSPKLCVYVTFTPQTNSDFNFFVFFFYLTKSWKGVRKKLALNAHAMAKMNAILECKLNKRCDSKRAKLKLSMLMEGRYRKGNGKGKSWTSRTERQTSGRRACEICMREKTKESWKNLQKFQTRLHFPLFNWVRRGTERWC